MKGNFRKSMTWLHVWIGLVLGWICYAIFVTGTASYFRPEITRWMRPELTASPGGAEAAQVAVRALEDRAADASRWFVDLPDARTAELKLYWQPQGGRYQSATIDPVTGGDVQARESLGGEFFYRFHFQLMMPHPWGRYTAGVAAMVMFVALITGVIAHRRFFAELFLLRPGRALSRSLLDFHNAAGVMSLPFFLMITFSGLVIFNALYLPWSGRALKAREASGGRQDSKTEAPAGWVTPAPLEPMIAEAARQWNSGPSVKRISATGRGTAGAEVEITRADSNTVSIRGAERLVFDGVTGELRSGGRIGMDDGPGQATYGFIYGLHLARFATPVLRVLLASLGLIGTGLIASGLLMWTAKRRAGLDKAGRGTRFGFWVVDKLNIAAMAGLPLAMAAFFWANRILPLGMEGRADGEVRCFVAVWLASLLHATLRPSAKAWREQLLAGSAAFILLPVLDAASGSYLWAAAKRFDWAYLSFHFVFIVTGVFMALAAGKAGRRTPGDRLSRGPQAVHVNGSQGLS